MKYAILHKERKHYHVYSPQMGPEWGLWEGLDQHVGEQPSLRFSSAVSALDFFSPLGNLLSSQMELSY